MIGNYVHIGEGSVVQANYIENYVHIGKNCVIGPRCKLKEACRIADNTVLPADTTVPSYALYAGNPGQFVEELPENTEYTMKENQAQFYQKYTSQFS